MWEGLCQLVMGQRGEWTGFWVLESGTCTELLKIEELVGVNPEGKGMW